MTLLLRLSRPFVCSGKESELVQDQMIEVMKLAGAEPSLRSNRASAVTYLCLRRQWAAARKVILVA